MGLVTPGFHLVDVRNDEALSYNSTGVAKLYGTPDAVLWYARLLPGMEIPAHTHGDVEDDALILSGSLSYPVSPGQEYTVGAGRWLVARPGEFHGYLNRTSRATTMLLFTPVVTPVPPGRSTSRIYTRVHQPMGEPRPRLTLYETDTSRGELIGLRPGERVPANGVRFAAAFCLDGRIMCLMKNDKLAIEASEGVCLVHTPCELVGASGMSTVALFSTLF
ncbi:MAG: cupin domain-containing protein [Planctomycetes bacterium]|nr:cupin domain-containing protein [Planctomycetota bacterium]